MREPRDLRRKFPQPEPDQIQLARALARLFRDAPPGDRPSVEFTGHEPPARLARCRPAILTPSPILGKRRTAPIVARPGHSEREWIAGSLQPFQSGLRQRRGVIIGAIELSCASHAAASAFRTASGSPLIARNKVLAGPLNRFAP